MAKTKNLNTYTMAKKKATAKRKATANGWARLTGVEKALRKDREKQRAKTPDPLDEMLKQHKAEREAERAKEEARIARNRAAVVAVLGSLGFEQPGYHVMDVPTLRDVRSRNNVDRPSGYGALIDSLTTTCAVLYHDRARAALAVDGIVDDPQLDFVPKVQEAARQLKLVRDFLHRQPRSTIVKLGAKPELLAILDAPFA